MKITSQHYYTRYQKFIKSCVPIEGYTENHHIIPKCMGGTDDPDNIIKLTARQHFIAHWMLWKAFNTPAMAYAFFLMAVPNRNHTGRTHRITSKTFSLLKKFKSKHQSELNTLRWQNPEWAEKQRKIMRRAASTPKERERRSKSALKYNEIYREKRSLAHKKRWKDNKWANNIIQKMKQRWDDPIWGLKNKKRVIENNKKRRKPISIEGSLYSHVSEAGIKLNISDTTIRYRIKSPNFPDWKYV